MAPVGGAEMNREQAIQAAQHAGVAPGNYITLQPDLPRYYAGRASGEQHDGWYVQNNAGVYQAFKIHLDGR
jgi:hypothetical protein